MWEMDVTCKPMFPPPVCKRRLLLLFCLFSICGSSYAQTGGLKGFLIDPVDSSAISYATVAVFNTRDSSVITYGLSDKTGGFELGKLPLNTPLRLLVSHVLYMKHLDDFTLDTAGDRNLDTLFLWPKSNELPETVVTWEVPPIVVRNDTVEFNADAFVGRPGSLVEELLKRLPGVVIDASGNITVNGRTVKKITIDSKQFFSDDPVILLKNIPSNAIEKIQITEEKDERGRATNSGEVTINLTLKPAAKKSHFGKAYAGYGTGDRYEAGAIWNFFRDTFQLSVLGYGNNLSQTGFSFSDLYQMGGFNRSGYNSAVWYNDGRTELDGASFGGGRGITESSGGGFNLNYDIPQKLKLSSSYFLSYSNTDYWRSVYSQTYFNDSTLYSATENGQVTKFLNHSARVNLKWTPDTIHLFSLTPSFKAGTGKTDNFNHTTNAFSLDPLAENRIDNTIRNDNLELNFTNYAEWNMRLKDWEHEIGSTQTWNQREAEGSNTIFQSVYDFDSSLWDNELERQQSLTWRSGTTYSQYYSLQYIQYDSFQVSFFASYEISNQKNDVSVYDVTEQNPGELLIAPLSTRFRERRETTSFGPTIRWYTKKGSFYGSLAYKYLDINLENELNANRIQRYFSLFRPYLNYSYRTKSSTTDISYYIDMEIPQSWQLLDLVDNTNPNRLSIGNPFLKPARKHEMRFFVRNSNATKKQGLSTNGRISYRENAVVTETYYDELGRQITRPVNLDKQYGNLSAFLSLSLYKSIQTTKEWKHSPRVGGYLSGSKSWSPVNGTLYVSESVWTSPSLGYALNKKDYFDASVSYDPSLSYSRLKGLSDWNAGLSHTVNLEIWWAPLDKYWVEAKCIYTRQVFLDGSVPGSGFTLLNAAFTRLVLKENRGQIRLSVFDALGQNQVLSRTATVNKLEESRSNAVTRYVMLGFVYNFNSFTSKGRQKRGFEFW